MLNYSGGAVTREPRATPSERPAHDVASCHIGCASPSLRRRQPREDTLKGLNLSDSHSMGRSSQGRICARWLGRRGKEDWISAQGGFSVEFPFSGGTLSVDCSSLSCVLTPPEIRTARSGIFNRERSAHQSARGWPWGKGDPRILSHYVRSTEGQAERLLTGHLRM